MAAYVTIGGTNYPVIFDELGEQANILQLPESTLPTSMKLYGVIEGDANPDRWISYLNFIAFLLRKDSVRVGSHNVTIGANTITFSSSGSEHPFSVNTYAFLPSKAYEVGMYNVVKYSDRVTFDAIATGAIEYLAILNT